MQRGLVRLAIINSKHPYQIDPDNPHFPVWRPRDNNGSANTIIVGEKHIRSKEIGQYANDMNKQDGSYLFEADQGREFNVARNIRFPFGTRVSEFSVPANQGPHADFGFGGLHAGNVLFLRFDCSTVALDPEIDPFVLCKLASAQDTFPFNDRELNYKKIKD
jgi:hypothetical protein